MAAPSLDVDWEAIKAHAIVHGVRQAARDYGIQEDTVKRRCSREGWLSSAGEVVTVQPLPKSMQPIFVPNVPTASQAARNSLADHGAKSRINLARAVRKGSIAAARMDGDAIIAKADKLKSLTDTGDKVFGWSNQAATPVLRLELIAGAIGSHQEMPAIDVESEVTPSMEEAAPSIDGTATNP